MVQDGRQVDELAAVRTSDPEGPRRNNAACVMAPADRPEEEPRAPRWAEAAVHSEQHPPEDERNPTSLDTLGVVHLRYGLIRKELHRAELAERLLRRGTMAGAAQTSPRLGSKEKVSHS